MDKFNVLPTDIRFLSLYEEQKHVIFEGVTQLPEEKLLRSISTLVKNKNEIIEKKPVKFVSKALRERMIKTMKASGLNDSQIENEIIRFGEEAKKHELNKVEEAIRKING